MIKANTININTANVDHDRIMSFGYGRWYTQGSDSSRSPINTILGQPFYHYFFITGFGYVNAGVSSITIEEDIFSTFWRDDMKLSGYVKRRHVTESEDNSNYYDLPEPTVTTDYIYESIQSDAKFDVFQGGDREYIYMLSGVLAKVYIQTDDSTIINLINSKIADVYDPITEGSYYSGIPNAGVTYVFDNIDDIVELISQLNALGYTNVTGELYMAPKALHQIETKEFKNSGFKYSTTADYQGFAFREKFTQDILSNTQVFTLIDTITLDKVESYHNAYTPKYKKCFSEQYYKVVLTNGSETREYNPSLLNGYTAGKFQFRVFVDNAPTTDLFCCPISYAGQSLTPFSEGLHIKYSKPVTVCNDTSKAGYVALADNISSNVIKLATEAAESKLYSDITKKAMPKVENDDEKNTNDDYKNLTFSPQYRPVNSNNDEMSMAGYQSNLLSQRMDVVRSVGTLVKEATDISGSIGRSNSKYGSTGSNVSNYACCLPKGNTSDTFCLYNKLVSLEDIKRVDTFFSRYGYSVEETTNEVPYRDTYTYIQGDLNIKNYSTMPTYARNDIEALFSSGITIWNQEMYEYDVTN
jgi:hypothetical protein